MPKKRILKKVMCLAMAGTMMFSTTMFTGCDGLIESTTNLIDTINDWFGNFSNSDPMNPSATQSPATQPTDSPTTQPPATQSPVTSNPSATTYTITYYETKGASNPNPTLYTTLDGVPQLRDLPDVEGYTFAGWYTEREGGLLVTNIRAGREENITLYAHWMVKTTPTPTTPPATQPPVTNPPVTNQPSATTYSITYDCSVGIAVANNGGNPTSYTSNDEIVLKNASLQSYTFLGWYDANGNKVEKIARGTTGDIKLKASFASPYNNAKSMVKDSATPDMVIKDGYEYSFIYHLGYIEHVVLSMSDTHEYRGVEHVYEFQTSQADTTSISKAITESTSHTDTWQAKLGFEAGIENKIETAAVSVKVTAELASGYSDGITHSNGTTTVVTQQNVTTKSITKPFDASTPFGWYAQVALGEVDVYAVVTYNAVTESYSVSNLNIQRPIVGYEYGYSAISKRFNEEYYGDLPFKVDAQDLKDRVREINDEFKKEYVAIKTQDDLKRIADNPSGKYVLANDISMSGTWKPIPTFSGMLDGNGFTISNLNLTPYIDGDNLYMGLFGTIKNGEVRNLKIDNAKIDFAKNDSSNTKVSYKHAHVGFLAGAVKEGNNKIYNCAVTNSSLSFKQDINVRYDSQGFFGGLIGIFDSGEVVGCYAYNNKIAGRISIGGLALTNSYEANSVAGGLIGAFGTDSATKTNTTLKDCYAGNNEISSSAYGYPGSAFAGGVIGAIRKEKTLERIYAGNNTYTARKDTTQGNAYANNFIGRATDANNGKNSTYVDCYSAKTPIGSNVKDGVIKVESSLNSIIQEKSLELFALLTANGILK